MTDGVEWRFESARSGFLTANLRASKMTRNRQGVYYVKIFDRKLKAQLSEVACMATRALELAGYVSVDLRVRQDGQIVVLEVNSNPGLWGAPLWNRPTFRKTLQCIITAGGFR